MDEPWSDWDRVIELPDREGILLPKEAASDAARAMECFRRYAAEVWQWPDRVTNAGVDGPHQYVNLPATLASPDDYRDGAVLLLRGENIAKADFDQAVTEMAEQMARDASDPGGWRRLMFAPPGCEVGVFWKIKTGYIG